MTKADIKKDDLRVLKRIAPRADWPRGPFVWHVAPATDFTRTIYVSIPFTWNLPEVRNKLSNMDHGYEFAVVGGPALDLMPDFFADLPFVAVGKSMPGILQRVNPMATRTTTGCVRKCGFCGIGTGKIEPGGLVELSDWPDLPIICDNNLLAASPAHFDRVLDRLEGWVGADFNQGIDARLLTAHHAERFARLRKPMIRLALDNMSYAEDWSQSFDTLRSAGVPLASIRSYALIGFGGGSPEEAWSRCRWIGSHGIKALPMWYHALDALEENKVTPAQAALGWTDEKRKDIMAYFYKHRDRSVPRKKRRLTVEAKL